jgi:predicted nicotinamide N-methyase
MTGQRTVQLQIPKDAEAGDYLTFHVDGVEMEIPIPQGSVAGQILEILVDDSASIEENEVEEEKQEYELSDDKQLVHLHESTEVTITIYNKLPKEGAIEGTSTDNSTTPCDGTYEMIWPAGLSLAKFVSSPSFHHLIGHPKVCLELGSGTGVVGLSYAVSCVKEKDLVQDDQTKISSNKRLKSSSNDKTKRTLILTDLPDALPILKFNIENVAQEVGPTLQTEFDMDASTLIWGQSDVPSHVDLILASDVLYNATVETYKSLKSTIESMDTNGTTKIIIAVRWRKPEEERRFFQMMHDAGYDFHLLHSAVEAYSLGWRDFGNPDSNASNSFFSETQLKVDGTLKDLKDITEDDTDIMSDSEYQAYENIFVQIYSFQKVSKHVISK